MKKKGHYNYSDELKAKVVQDRQNGKSYGQIASELVIPKSSVQSIVAHFNAHGSVDSLLKNNRRPKITEPDVDELIVRLAKRNLTTKEIQTEVMRIKGVQISKHTVKHRINSANLKRVKLKNSRKYETVMQNECNSSEPLPVPEEEEKVENTMDHQSVSEVYQLRNENAHLHNSVKEMSVALQQSKEEILKLQQMIEMKDSLIIRLNERQCASCHHVINYT